MAKSSVDTPSRAATSAQNSLVRLIMRGTAIGLFAVLACFIYLIVYELPHRNQLLAQQLSGELAAGQARLLDDRVQLLQARLDAAADDPALIAGLDSGTVDIAAAQAALRRAFPEALTVQLIPLGPLGIAGLDTAAFGLRNNIEVDMLSRVSDGAHIPPEAYAVDGRWLISFAHPLHAADARYSSGAILLTLPATRLQTLLGSHLAGRGASALLRKVGSQSRPVFAAGQGERDDLRQLRELSVPQWQLQFTPSAQWLAHIEQSPLPLWLLAGLSAAAILGGALLSMRDFRRALERNLLALAGNQPVDLPGFAQFRQQLQKRRPAEAAAERAAPARPVAKPAGAPPQPKPKPKPKAKPQPEPEPAQPVAKPEAAPAQLPDTIFRAYDIRGVARHQLTDEIVYQIGLAIGSEAVDRGQQEIVVARDGRGSSTAIAEALTRALRDSGRDVIDIGMVPTPLLYFATHQLGAESGVMVTGSHNPPEYNGLKIVLGGRTLAGRAIEELKERIQQRRFTSGQGGYRVAEIEDRYVDYIVNDVAIAQPLKVVIDAGNGVAGAVAPRLFQELGCDVTPLYCDVDPAFPNHHPDPTIAANLIDLIRVVQEQGADLGIAFDGDGDRVGVVSGSGAIVPADRLLMLLAQDVVSRNPGADVLFDVKSSRSLNTVISSFGGRPIMWKSGHSFMKEKMAETGALLGGEFSGHIFFNERWFGFDDGLYAAARLIEILSTSDPDLDNHLAALPAAVGTPELKVETTEQAKFDIVATLAEQGRFPDGKITTLDGIRVDFPDGWGLVRASNTTPALTLRFEADSEAALARIQALFRDQLAAIDPALTFGF